MKWFIDFDDTLVLGPTTWAVQTVIPKMLKEHSLPYNAALLDKALLEGQEKAASGVSDIEILDTLFRLMRWPAELKQPLLQEVFEHYTPTIFDDAVPFLTKVAKRGQSVYIVSNNNMASKLVEKLGLSAHLADVFTPKGCGLERGKPYRDIWDYISARCDIEHAVLVGDDPWSDGAFATTCGIPCYIVDRLNRFHHLRDTYQLVSSLNDLLPL